MPRPPLSPREQQVWLLMLQPLSPKEMAARLEIAAGTVKAHIESILQKRGERSRFDAVVRHYQSEVDRLKREIIPF